MARVIAGIPDEARWVRSEPRRTWPIPLLTRMVHAAFPGCRILEKQPLADGLRNANFLLRLDATSYPVVLRIYEHDPSLCQKEADLNHLVAGSVPVPELIYVAPLARDDFPPFHLAQFIEGISFRDLKRSGDTDAIAEAAFSAGETLAAIGRYTFSDPGWLTAGPSVAAPLFQGEDTVQRFLDLCLASQKLQERIPDDLGIRIQKLVWSSQAKFARMDEGESRLVHGDFHKRNLLVRCVSGHWSVAAVLDWEFAFSGSQLVDFGNLLRYELASRPLIEPHFSAGYLHAGGALPGDWKYLARLIDLTAICESLTHEYLTDAVVAELLEMVRATVENRDPQLS